MAEGPMETERITLSQSCFGNQKRFRQVEIGQTKIKKGGRCKPPSSTDPPKPEHSRGCVPATPGSQYFICDLKMQVGCQAMGQRGFPFIRLKQWELGSGNSSRLPRELQNPTKSHR